MINAFSKNWCQVLSQLTVLAVLGNALSACQIGLSVPGGVLSPQINLNQGRPAPAKQGATSPSDSASLPINQTPDKTKTTDTAAGNQNPSPSINDNSEPIQNLVPASELSLPTGNCELVAITAPNFRVVNASSSWAMIQWDHLSQTTALQYDLYLNDQRIQERFSLNTIIVSGLNAEQLYSFSIAAFNGECQTSPTQAFTFTTLKTGAALSGGGGGEPSQDTVITDISFEEN